MIDRIGQLQLERGKQLLVQRQLHFERLQRERTAGNVSNCRQPKATKEQMKQKRMNIPIVRAPQWGSDPEVSEFHQGLLGDPQMLPSEDDDVSEADHEIADTGDVNDEKPQLHHENLRGISFYNTIPRCNGEMNKWFSWKK